jgi:hypothetical protein
VFQNQDEIKKILFEKNNKAFFADVQIEIL